MADDTEEITDERATELSSVAAIYPELLIDPSNRLSATIDIPVEPNTPLAIFSPASSFREAQAGPLNPTIPCEVPPDRSSPFPVSHRNTDLGQVEKAQNTSIEEPLEDIHLLSNLPPLILQINLPDGYPSQHPPHFFLSTSIPWIPTWRLRELQDAGHTLWQEIGKEHVVFTYIDHLREAAEDGFNLASLEADYLKVSQDLKLALLDFDLKAKRAKFEQQTFQCSICLEPKKGVKCHRLRLCSHVFCVGCLQDFFNTCITEGDVSSVKCIAPGCGEDSASFTQCADDRTLDPNELLQIPLSQEQVQRYVTLKRKKKYEADPTTVYCPRTWCQGPARTKASEAAEASLIKKDGNNFGVEVTKSNGTNSSSLPPADRLAICQDCRFAFCQVCKASWHGELKWCSVRNKGELTAEEKASAEYMKLHCSNPYEHFNNKKSPCYMRLWELEGGDGGEGVGIGFGGGIGDGFVDSGDDSDFGDSDFSDDESDEDDVLPPPPPRAPIPQPAARGRGRGRARGVRGGRAGRGWRGGRGGAPNVQHNARAQAGLQRAAAVAILGNDPVLPMQDFLAAL